MKGLERGLQTQLWPGGTENSRGDLGRGGAVKENKYSRGRSGAWLDRVWRMDKD